MANTADDAGTIPVNLSLNGIGYNAALILLKKPFVPAVNAILPSIIVPPAILISRLILTCGNQIWVCGCNSNTMPGRSVLPLAAMAFAPIQAAKILQACSMMGGLKASIRSTAAKFS